MAKFQSENQVLSLERTTWKQRRDILASDKALQLIKVFTPPVINHCLDMEQFVVVPASVCNKNLITRSVTKHELPKYQPSQNATYQFDSFKKEINKKFFPRSLFSRQNFDLSTYLAPKFTNVNFIGCRNCIFPIRLCSTTESL